MKIFLDDYRTPSKTMKGFSVVRSYETCIQLLEVFKTDVEMIDLDFELGSKESGLDVLKYMSKSGIVPRHINIHSDHQEGAPMMVKYAEKHFPDTVVTSTKTV